MFEKLYILYDNYFGIKIITHMRQHHCYVRVIIITSNKNKPPPLKSMKKKKQRRKIVENEQKKNISKNGEKPLRQTIKT